MPAPAKARDHRARETTLPVFMGPRLRGDDLFDRTTYFGSTLWSPSRLPGGGITGIRASGLGGVTCMPGSTVCGGWITPLERSSWSLRLPRDDCPSVSVFGCRSRSEGVD